MKFNIDFKKFLILIFALVLLFIPTYFAIASFYMNQKAPLSDEIIELQIKDPDGNTASFLKATDDEGIFAIFQEMNTSGESIASLPENISGGSFLLGTYKRENGETLAYKYYFSSDADNCYFDDSEGKHYHLPKSTAKRFINTKYASYLYTSASTPILTLSDGSKIIPGEMSWSYLAGGIYRTVSDIVTSAEKQEFELQSDLGVIFDIIPDLCNIKIFNGDLLILEGSVDKLSELKLDKNATLRIELDADWNKADGKEYYGEAKYSFVAHVNAPAVFTLGESSIEPGTFVVISGLNVTDISKIGFSSEPEIGCEPKFFADGSFVRALIPISYDLKATSYKFTITYGVVSQTLELSVPEKTFGKSYAYTDLKKDFLDANFSKDDQEEYKNVVAEVTNKNEEIKYFSGKFLNYEHSDIGIAIGFGRYLPLSNGETINHVGVDYIFNAGSEVPVLNSGKVCYVGICDVLGKFIVVDHGLGLKSWYAHLSEASVSVGEIVNKGQSVGKVGDTGFIPTTRLHIGFTVAGIPVSPYPLQDFGVVMPNS